MHQRKDSTAVRSTLGTDRRELHKPRLWREKEYIKSQYGIGNRELKRPFYIYKQAISALMPSHLLSKKKNCFTGGESRWCLMFWHHRVFAGIKFCLTTLKSSGHCTSPSPLRQPGGNWLQLHISPSLPCVWGESMFKQTLCENSGPRDIAARKSKHCRTAPNFHMFSE